MVPFWRSYCTPLTRTCWDLSYVLVSLIEGKLMLLVAMEIERTPRKSYKFFLLDNVVIALSNLRTFYQSPSVCVSEITSDILLELTVASLLFRSIETM